MIRLFILHRYKLFAVKRRLIFYSRNPLIFKKQKILKNMKILIITIIFIVVILYTHRRHCTNDPLTLSGRKVRCVRNYKNKYHIQIKFFIWGWIDVTYSTILDSTFNYFPEFKTEEDAKAFLRQLNESILDPQKRGTVKIQTYIKDYVGNKTEIETVEEEE